MTQHHCARRAQPLFPWGHSRPMAHIPAEWAFGFHFHSLPVCQHNQLSLWWKCRNCRWHEAKRNDCRIGREHTICGVDFSSAKQSTVFTEATVHLKITWQHWKKNIKTVLEQLLNMYRQQATVAERSLFESVCPKTSYKQTFEGICYSGITAEEPAGVAF